MEWIKRNIINGNLIQKFSFLIFVINLLVTPLIYNNKSILGDNSFRGDFFYEKSNQSGMTYEEFYLWIFIGIVSLFSIYLFKDKDEGN